MRYCEDTGLFSIDRSRLSCIHATRYCKEHCYNKKLYRVFPGMVPKDDKNEIAWKALTGATLRKELAKKKLPTKRFRFMTRGEAFTCSEDVEKIRDILTSNPATLFWIPTRAWRNATLRKEIEITLLPLRNARIMASIDPSNTSEELTNITNWSIMGFGWQNKEEMEEKTGLQAKNCPKTYDHIKGACRTCKGRCFSPKRQVIFLDKH